MGYDRLRWLWPATVLVFACGSACHSGRAQDDASAHDGTADRSHDAAPPGSEGLPPESRQFDFWLGEWDGRLRELQPDLSWKDTRVADARLYPALNGKAMIELWDEAEIKGFSIRYYDAAKKAWALWLNWPGPNASGWSPTLEGGFRHGRGEFFRMSKNGESQLITRYTFSDITPSSLRWDDGYSTDGGKTWAPNWIMEFSRRGPVSKLPLEGGPAHTFQSGARCDQKEFRRYEFLAGKKNALSVIDGGPPLPGTVTGYKILDGCAVFALAEYTVGGATLEVFFHLTFNASLNSFQLLRLDSQPDTSATLFHGRPGSSDLEFLDVATGEGEPGVEVEIREGPDGSIVWVESRAPESSAK